VQRDWTSSSERFLVVGERFEELLQVRVRLLVPNFQAAGLMGAKLRLQYNEAAEHVDNDKEHFFEETSRDPLEWVVPKRTKGSDQYEYTVTWISSDGTQNVVGPRTTQDEELLLHPAL
jgi:hypothetical protein